jgi:hypothetical protein
MMPNGKDFVYWLRSNVKMSLQSYVYYVKDGVGLSLCDPDYEKESLANLKKQFAANEAIELQNSKAAAEKIRKEDEYKRANANQIQNQTKRNDPPEYEYVTVDCGYCNKTGKIYFEKLAVKSGVTSVSVDYYGKATYTNSYGTGSVDCSACRGKGRTTQKIIKK